MINNPFILDHQVQRLHRGDSVPRVRPQGRQALDPPHPQGQGQHQEGAQRLQVLRDGRARREQTSHQVRVPIIRQQMSFRTSVILTEIPVLYGWTTLRWSDIVLFLIFKNGHNAADQLSFY